MWGVAKESSILILTLPGANQMIAGKYIAFFSIYSYFVKVGETLVKWITESLREKSL